MGPQQGANSISSRASCQGREHPPTTEAKAPWPLWLFLFPDSRRPFSRLTPLLFPDSRRPFSRLTPRPVPTRDAETPGRSVKMAGRHAGVAARDAKTLHLEQFVLHVGQQNLHGGQPVPRTHVLVSALRSLGQQRKFDLRKNWPEERSSHIGGTNIQGTSESAGGNKEFREVEWHGGAGYLLCISDGRNWAWKLGTGPCAARIH